MATIDERRGQTRPTGAQYDTTRDGHRISINRQPRKSLRPWVGHVYGMELGAPENSLISCGIFTDTPMLRGLLHGDWQAQSADGSRSYHDEVLLFGPHSKRMPVSVGGGFASVGLSLRAGAVHALGGPPSTDLLDRIVPHTALPLADDALLDHLRSGTSAEEWMSTLEDFMEALVEQAGRKKPDPVSAGFHQLALEDPNIPVSECAERLNVDQRRLERIVKRDFGLSPKRVLRRARALDLAAHLCGVADDTEAQELALRYFDQSHLNREFTAMFGMTPRRFLDTPQPLLTITLESRQARRLEELDRIEQGEKRPWQ
jgi:AraC-like DNA-binding protein